MQTTNWQRETSQTLPAQWTINGLLHRNKVIKLLRKPRTDAFKVGKIDIRGVSYPVLSKSTLGSVVLASRGQAFPIELEVLKVPGFHQNSQVPTIAETSATWLRPRCQKPSEMTTAERMKARDRALSSLHGRFILREGTPPVVAPSTGLRSPQIGAVYAVLAHWTVKPKDTATVVMPTGTGKTETMLSLFAHQRLDRLLIIVPSDALRKQIVHKFAHLGLLEDLNLLTKGFEYPVVGSFERGFATVEDAREFFLSCNVVVATMKLLATATLDIRAAIAENTSHVFIDEAHHVPAHTWAAVRGDFANCRIVQFTATPFREDGKFVDGSVVYRYPLAKAQQEGYFNRIRFAPIAATPVLADHAIAERAVRQLREDIAAGRDHLLMARTSTIADASIIHGLYEQTYPEFAPVILHSSVSSADRALALKDIESRSSRIIVCVDMFGEGVDLPALKIAALHDSHKSLTVTLQFIGRFARSGEAYGDATVVANVLDSGFESSLRKLYSQDADWNSLLETLTEDASSRHAKQDAFTRAFTGDPAGLALQNVYPKMSTIIYRSASEDWDPGRALEAFDDPDLIISGPLVNAQDATMVFVTRHEEAVPWGDVRGLIDIVYHLHILHWNASLHLLFINTSDSQDMHQALARVIVGASAELITGEDVFRSLHGINRLLLLNLGLRHLINKRIQYNSMMGTDIGPALSSASRENRIKWNLFGIGFEGGEPANVGCSQKGRIWSHRVAADIPEWIDWATHVGRKVIDDSLTTDALLEGAIIPTKIDTRPVATPISLEWDSGILERPEQHVFIELDGALTPFFLTDLTIIKTPQTNALRFAVVSDEKRAEYDLLLDANGYRHVGDGSSVNFISFGSKRLDLITFLDENPPLIRFANDSFLRGNVLYQTLIEKPRLFDRTATIDWDWTGTDPVKESQTISRDADSIQARLIRELRAGQAGYDFDIIFDDDGPGEAADVVAIKVDGARFVVHLYHCKFTSNGFRRAQIGDLYEVCGQAQKSTRWRRNVLKLLDHLIHRDSKGLRAGTRFEIGSLAVIPGLRVQLEQCEIAFKIFIVQPGFSKSRASEDQLALLGSTELFLQETLGISLGLIASA